MFIHAFPSFHLHTAPEEFLRSHVGLPRLPGSSLETRFARRIGDASDPCAPPEAPAAAWRSDVHDIHDSHHAKIGRSHPNHGEDVLKYGELAVPTQFGFLYVLVSLRALSNNSDDETHHTLGLSIMPAMQLSGFELLTISRPSRLVHESARKSKSRNRWD